MASRRSAGGMNTGSQLVQMYIQDQMARQRTRQQYELQGRNQLEDDLRQFILNSAGKVSSGEYNPSAFGPEVQSRIGNYYNTSQLAPSLDKRVGGAIAPVLGKSKYEDIPDEQGIMQLLAQAGVGEGQYEDPIVTNALNAVKARKESLKPFIPATAVSQYDPTSGANRTKYVPQNELGGMNVQTGPTPTQSGQNKTAEALAGELSPAMTQGKITQTNAINAGTQASEARKAGAVSNAQAMGANANNVNDQKFDLFSREEAIRQQNALDLKAAPSGNTANDSIGPLITLQRVKELNARIPEQRFVGRMKTGVQSFLGLDTDAADMDAAAKSGGITIAKLLGNTGQISDADAAAGENFFPKSHQPLAIRNRRLMRLEQLITYAPLVNAQLGPNASLADKLAFIKDLMEKDEASKGLPPIPDDVAPATPTEPQVNIREF